MSAVSGISANTPSIPSVLQNLQKQFQQLSKDLKAGNLSAAQSDFVTIQGELQPSSAATTASSQTSNSVAQAFTQLGKDLQSGNLSAAQQDFSTIKQDLQGQSSTVEGHHHSDSDNDSSSTSPISKLITTLGQQLQSGDLTGAQQTFASLQQDLPQLSQVGTSSATASTASASTFSVSA